VTEESLRRYLAWAERHYFKHESYGDIADDCDVRRSLVQRQVEFILTNLEPELLERRYQLRASSLLKAAGKLPDPRKAAASSSPLGIV
jgi:hypothetical protein